MSDLLDEAHEFLLCMDKMEYADALFALRAELTATPPADAALADRVTPSLIIHYGQVQQENEKLREEIAALRARAVPDGFVVIPAAWFDREIPRIDAGGANPITPDEHCCEWVLYQERERIHLALSAALAASKAGDGGAG